MLCLSLAACSSDTADSDSKQPTDNGTSLNDSTEQSDNGSSSLSVEEMIENFEPPANIVSVDMTAEDPSNGEIVFTFQEDGKIQNCVYRMNGEKVMVTYGYDTMEKGQIWVLAFSEDSTVIAEESFKELSENNLNIYTCLICPVCRYNTLKYVSIPAVLCLTQNKLSCV